MMQHTVCLVSITFSRMCARYITAESDPYSTATISIITTTTFHTSIL